MYQSRQEKTVPVSARKPVKRKDKDKPKRPLSAYNFFFKEERAKINAIAHNEEGSAELKEKDPELADEILSKLRKEDGKVSFEEMGKVIGRRWKVASQERKEYCNELAGRDTERYKEAVEKYNQKKEELREKNKRAAELQYSEMAAAQAQHNSGMPPPMMKYSEMQPPQPGMYPAQMGYGPPHPMDQNIPHGYPHQMNMMGAHYPYYMPPMPPSDREGSSPNGQPANQDMNNYPRTQGNYPPHTMPHGYYNQQALNGYYRSEMSRNGNNDQPINLQQQGKQSPQNLVPDTNISSSHAQRSYSSSNNQGEHW